MHQDQRIGLALAVLLLGAAGAFFFRHDPHPSRSSPRLKSAQELDARIAEKSVSPYLQSLDDKERPSEAGDLRADIRDDDTRPEPNLPPLDDPDVSWPTEVSAFDSRSRSASAQSAFDNTGEPPQNLAPIPIDEDEIFASPGAESERIADRTSESERIHIVLKGESLSSIAARELGNANRFTEIFEANRDQLKNANDVRIGMSLRIPMRHPDHNSATSAVPVQRPGRSAPPLLPSVSDRQNAEKLSPISSDEGPRSAEPESEEPTSPRKRFEPVKRPPAGIQRIGPQTGSPRRLTQVPPKDAGDGTVAR